MISAHGVTYTTVEQAREAVAALEADNARYGASDGRVTEINAINAAIAEQAPEATEQAPRETVVVDDEDGRWTVVKQTYGTECHHPSCAILHRHLAKERYFDGGWHEEWATHNGRDVQVRVNRWHERTVTEWLVLRNGERVADAYDTKREAVRRAEQKPTY